MKIRVAIYELATGNIRRFVTAQPADIDIQVGEGEEFFLNCPLDATQIIDNEPYIPEPPEIPPPDPMVEIVKSCNRMLRACDWTQLSDAPLTPTEVAAWADYRAALRDPDTISATSPPTWPVAPGPTDEVQLP